MNSNKAPAGNPSFTTPVEVVNYLTEIGCDRDKMKHLLSPRIGEYNGPFEVSYKEGDERAIVSCRDAYFYILLNHCDSDDKMIVIEQSSEHKQVGEKRYDVDLPSVSRYWMDDGDRLEITTIKGTHVLKGVVLNDSTADYIGVEIISRRHKGKMGIMNDLFVGSTANFCGMHTSNPITNLVLRKGY